MPTARAIERARRDRRQGKSPSTQAGEFVREEIESIRAGKHGARSAKQAIAIGLSEARRAGVKLPPSKSASAETRRKAKQDSAAVGRKPSRKRSQATLKALRRESTTTVSRRALSKQTKTAAKKRSASERSAAARKAVRTKGPAARSAAAPKAARTRARKA